MLDRPPPLAAFRPAFVAVGVLYLLLASSMLVRGAVVLEDFGVSPELASEPVLEDFFLFFYQLMAFVGVLTIAFGLVTRERGGQVLVTTAFCLANLLWAYRDLSTSDSAFGSRLYRGEATLVFVAIDLGLAALFGALAIRGLAGRSGRGSDLDARAARAP